jgi:protocatechuate 3,4-dioxygenase beta subunit
MKQALALLAVLAAASAAAQAASGAAAAPGCPATPSDAAGPFGRGLPPVRAKIGTGHVLTGVILSAADCKPIAGALVQFWQSGRNGYTRAGSATVRTNAAGRFRFEGPVPSTYGREPHIHIRVSAKDHETLLTRYVVAPGSRSGTVRLVLVPEAV